MAIAPLHVVFSMSAAFDLRKALAKVRRRDQVVALCDDLSFGPIDPPDPDLRARWVEAELGYEDWGESSRDVQAFWIAALSDQHRRVAWMSRRSAQEFAGFLEFVSRLGNAPCEVIDLTDVTVAETHKEREPSARRLALSLALLQAREILENKLLEQAQPLTEERRADYLAAWKTLRAENAALRVLDADLELRSAPISFFDQQLLSSASPRWQKAARIVGDALSKFWENARCQTGDELLAARLRALVEAGLLEAQGDLSRIRFSEVKLPAIRA